MIQALATMGDGRTLIMIGLSQGNIDRLQRQQPIHVDPAVVLGLKATDIIGGILIFYGKSEGDITKVLHESGLITDNTVVRPIPRGSRTPT